MGEPVLLVTVDVGVIRTTIPWHLSRILPRVPAIIVRTGPQGHDGHVPRQEEGAACREDGRLGEARGKHSHTHT